ncbi:hypothetical protein GGD66_007994 [Bradyrhizobium sp. CIR48]|nr:hypothetical protein [Bradyrhizobium sp. CIR18]MBB4429392.1 hypothetical protein [Bradyrhizobium sp. CIR48]
MFIPRITAKWSTTLATAGSMNSATSRAPSDPARAGARNPRALCLPRIQELNVAFGGTLAKDPDGLPEDQRHGTPDADNEDARYRLRQKVTLRKGGVLQQICGADASQ